MIGQKGLNIFVENISSFGLTYLTYLNISGNNICCEKSLAKLLQKIPNCKNIDLSFNKLKSI